MEPYRNKGFVMCGWKTNLLMLASFMIMSFVFLFASEGTRPLLLVFAPETEISSLNWYFGDREQTKAMWAYNEQEELGVPRVVERKWRLTSSLDQPRGDKIEEEVSVDGTWSRGNRGKPVYVPSSWETFIPENFVDGASTSTDISSITADVGQILYEEENTTSINTVSSKDGDAARETLSSLDNDEIAGDLLSSRTENEDKVSNFPSQTMMVKMVKDVSSATELPEADIDIIVNSSTSINLISSRTPFDSAAEVEVESVTTRSEDFEDAASDATNTSSSGVCDFTRGYWVRDENRPLYDGKKCSAFLSTMWACRQLNRPDFEYEKLRWQADGCDMPTFTSQGFLERMRNKVIAFVGDSLGRQQFQSLMCMLTEGKDEDDESAADAEDIAEEWGLGPSRAALRGKGYAYKFKSTNTTVMFYWSATLNLLEHDRPDEESGWTALHLDRPDVFLRDEIQKLDLLILNSGHHWNTGKFDGNKWHSYLNGEPLAGRGLIKGIGEAYNLSMYKIVEYLDATLAQTGGKMPTVFMRTLSPRHFKNGEWNSGGTCDNTRPQLQSRRVVVYSGPTTDTVINYAVKGSRRVHLLNITPSSSSREEGHISRYGKGQDSGHQDCLHWCLPGVPDTWNELLYAHLAVDSTLASSTGLHDGDATW